MSLRFRHRMRDFADFFTLRRSKKLREKNPHDSLGRNKRKRKQQLQQQQLLQQQQRQQKQKPPPQQQQQDQQQEQQYEQQHLHHQLQHEQQQHQQQPQKKKGEEEIEVNLSLEISDESSSSQSDSDDSVFSSDETCLPQAGESHAASDDERNDGGDNGLASCFYSYVPRKHSRTLPSIVVEDGQRLNPRRGSIGNRHRSESHILKSQTRPSTSDSPNSQERAPEITFDETSKDTSGGRGWNYFRRPKKTPFTVKYTKVYGEADGAYRNDSTPRGLVFVCNFSKFKNEMYSERVGSEKDFDNMINLFQQLGYDPFYRRRRYCLSGYITKKTFMEKLGLFAKEVKHKVLCSCVVILMSHGTGPKTFVTSDNQEVDLLDTYKIFDNINCPFLLGKPKIFILQFCRSREITSGREKTSPEQLQLNNEQVERIVKEQVSEFMRKYVRKLSFSTFVAQGIDKNQLFVHIEEKSRQASLASLSSSILEQEQTEEGAQVSGSTPRGHYEADTNRIPAIPQVGFQRYSDMYSIFSTSPGELSHRHPEKGSLLIQAICHEFAEYAYQDDIDNLVRRVSTYMTKTLQKDDPITVPRQTCERTNNGLDKLFYFNPYEMLQDRQFTI